MHKFLITVAAAASALAIAAPAAAQYYPAPQRQHGNAYGYHNNGAQQIVYRIDQFRRDVWQFNREGRLSRNETNRIDQQLMRIRNDAFNAGRNGISSRENRSFDQRLDRLRAQMRAEMRDGNNRRGTWNDRDRDGRNDRYEDDRGYRHD